MKINGATVQASIDYSRTEYTSHEISVMSVNDVMQQEVYFQAMKRQYLISWSIAIQANNDELTRYYDNLIVICKHTLNVLNTALYPNLHYTSVETLHNTTYTAR